MKRNRSIFRGCLAAAVLATLIGGNAWAATYDRGLTGSTDDQKWLQNGTVTESDGVVTYKLDGANHAFQSGEEDTAALYVQGKKVVLDNTKEGGRGNITLTGTTDSFMSSSMGVWAIGLADGSHLTVNSDLSLSANHPDGWSSSAIYAGKLGAGEGANTDFTLNGNLTIRKGDASNPYEGGASNMYGGYNNGYTGSRWAPTGLFNGQIDGSAWNFNGDVDIAWRGTAVATDPYYDRTEHGYSNYENAVVHMNGGSVKIDTPDDPTYGYYALANYGGSININVTKDGAGTHDVTLLGNVITMKDPGGEQGGGEYFYRDGQTNIGLTTAASKWQGVIDNAGTDYAGEVNVWLQNGASWEHQSRGKTNGLDAEHMPSPSKDHYKTYDGITHVHKLAGGSSASSAGVIFRNDEAPISIADYSGYTTVIYKHDGTAPKTITGGDFKITSAAENSSITLLTDSEGITEGFADSDSAGAKNHVSEVLNKLANKLWYANHTDGHLTGTVRIAEGLTASSVAKKTGDITFSTSGTGTGQDGQGFYAYTPASDVPGSQTVTEFSDAITGDRTNNQNYVAAGVLREDDVYRFTKDSTVEVTGEKAVDVQKDVVIDASDTTLTLKNHSGMYGISQTSDNKAEITAKKLIIDAKTAARTEAIHVQGGETSPSLTIHGDTEITAVGKANTLGAYVQTGSTLTFDGNVKASIDGNNGGWDYYGATALYATSAMSDTTGGTIVVNGDVDLSGSANGVFVNSGGARAIIHGGGRIQMDASKNSYAALRAEDGIIDMNVTKDEGGTVTGASDHAVQIEGNVAVTTGAVHSNDKHGTLSQVNLGLNTADSVLHGVVYNAFPAEGKTTGGLTFTGESNLWLANGAVWNNEAVGKVGKSWGGNNFKGSVLTKLTGGSDADYAGVIFQNDENPISVDNYSGNTTVIYKHDGTAPKTITGGDFKITSAAENSSITLLTDSEGITEGFADSDSAGAKNHVSEVLNKLANKLWYANHTDGHLTGTVRIAEGLTASSVAKKTGDITFSTSGTGTGQDGQGFYAYTPASDTKNGPITTNEVIDKTRTADSDGNILVAVTEPTAEGRFVSAMYAGSTSYDKQHPMTVDLSGHDLTLQANSSDKIAAAIYATDNAHLKLVNSGKDKKLTVRASNTDTRGANGIYVKGSYAGVSIKGGVDIDGVTTKGDAAAGISIQGKQSEVTIDGPLAIRNVYGERHRGDGINASGILLTGDESRAMVDGLVTVEGVQGAALKTVGKDTVLSVAGGTITAAEDKGRDHNYYAARVDKGTININMNGAEVGSNTTKITGDMYATGQYGKRVVEYSGGELVDWVNAGKLNVALTDKDSFWQGMAAYDQYNDDYGTGGNTMHDIGEFNLYLQNGATWTNEQQSHLTTTTIKKAEYKGSQLATLHGGSDADHAGVIFQNDERPITVNTYSGNTTVIYKHDASNPQTVIGGDFKITNAAENSAITLLTDNTAVTADNRNDVLNALAGKLWYMGYVDKHLTGMARIAEGLTDSSAEVKSGFIAFSDGTTGTMQAGQGYYQTDTPIITGGNTIYGLADKDVKYVKNGIRQDDGTYKFTEDYVVAAVDSDVTEANLDDYDKGVAAVVGKGNDVSLDANGHELTLKADSTTKSVQGVGIYANKNAVIKAKNLNLQVTSNQGNAKGIYVHNGGDVTINGDISLTVKQLADGQAAGVDLYNGRSKLQVNGNLTMKGEEDGYGVSAAQKSGYGSTKKYDAKGIYIYDNDGASLTVTGDTDMAVKGVGIDMRGSKNNMIDLQGNVSIITPDDVKESESYQLINGAKGTLYIGMNEARDGASGKDVTLQGEINDSYANLHIGLGTRQSKWTGYVNKSTYGNGNVNLYLENGSTWNNRATNVQASYFNGSHVTKLAGGSDADHAGIIFQNDSKPITVDNYSGNTTILYKHEIVDNTARENAGFYGNKAASIIGGDFRIENAADGSAITLRTDRDGLNLDSTLYTDKNLVNDTLDKLANKLYYTANDGKLAGKVEIAEGLTASSVAKKTGDISFSTSGTGTGQDGQGFYAYTPASDVPGSQTVTEFSDAITGVKANDMLYVNTGVLKDDGENYYFTKDSTIIAAPSVKISNPGHAVNVDAAGKTMKLNNIVSANSEGTVITAKTMDVTVKGSNRLEAVNTTAGNLTVNGDVNLHTDGGSGYIMGIYAAHGNQLTINGNVTMKRDDGYELDGGAGFGYYAHSAIYAANGQKVDVTGDVDFKVNGNGVFANQGGADVMLAGGSIEIDKSNTSAGHAALRAESSTVSMNVQKDNGGDITGAGTHKVNLLGNVAATTGAVHSAEPHLTSVVNLGLSTQDSAWTGVAYNAFPAEGKQTDSTIHTGAINVWLQNGAAWTNESYGPAGGSWGGNDFKGSRVTKLTGGAGADKAGVICQNDTNPISVDSYSGNTTVLYKHEIVDDTARENAGLYGNKAASIIGGDFKIAKAADGSAITLRTDRDGLNLDSTLYTDKNLVNDTLDKLANKLYYTANDGKLAGKVEIAEGLTASSVSKRLENITFSTESTGTKTAGQGYYQYDLIYPDSQITNPMSKTIDGTQEAEDAYRNAGIYKPGTDEYAFTEDPATVNGDKDKVVDGTNKNLKLKGKTLELVAQDGGTGVYTEGGRKVAIDNTADITAKDGTGVQADGEGSLVSLTNGGSVQEAASGIQATNKGTVDIKGSFDVNATDKAISATDGGTVNVAAGTLKGRIEAQNGVVNLNSVEAAAPLKVEGDIETAGEGKVTAHFKGAGSGLAGNVAGDGTVELTVSDGAAWKGDSTGEGATTVTLGKNGTWAGSSTNNKMIVNLAGRWTPTADSTVDELNGKGGTLDKSNAASGTTNIGSYSGSTNVVYRHDASDPTKIVGGKVVIGTAAANSKVNLITDRDGLDLGSGKAADKNKVSETLNQLAHMLTYKDHGANENLKGSVKIAEGLTAGSSDLRSEAITFGEDGVGKYDYTATTEEKPEVIEGNYETKLMKGAKEAMIGAISLWRNNNNDLQRRMGDLRLSREENGIWARYLGGKSAMDSQNTEVDSRYNIYQVGYDHKAGDWTFGAALDHGKSSDSLSGGHGDGELTTLSAYGSLLKKDGQYLDLIARASRVKDEYTVRGELGHKLDGDYKTWGLSLSAEYGKRFTQDNGFYFDPSVELTIGRLNGKDYDAVSDYSGNKKLHVSQEAFNSAIGRIGFGIGQETEKANYFAKLALAHEFAGDIDTTFRADNEPTKNTHIDLGDTWLELELGGTAQLSKNTYLYGTYTRSYGAEVKTKWRADAGLRFTF